MVLALILVGGGYQMAKFGMSGDARGQEVFIESTDKSVDLHNINNSDEINGQGKDVVVHVVGAVDRPGVYTLPGGSRVIDAIEAASPAGDARLDLLNLALLLLDGQQVYVYSEDDYQKHIETGGQVALPGNLSGLSVASGGTVGSGGNLVNINTAEQAQLETLPGIGPSLAGRIIDYRNSNGRFMSTEEIMNVSGIGEKRYEDLKDRISVY